MLRNSVPGHKSVFRAGFWPDCHQKNTKIGPPAGLPGSSPAKIWPGKPISGPEALLRNIEYVWYLAPASEPACNARLLGHSGDLDQGCDRNAGTKPRSNADLVLYVFWT